VLQRLSSIANIKLLLKIGLEQDAKNQVLRKIERIFSAFGDSQRKYPGCGAIAGGYPKGAGGYLGPQ
jgi:hypothetical protein